MEQVKSSDTTDKLPERFRPEWRALAGLLLLLLFAAWLFFDTIEDLSEGDPLVLVDRSLFLALQGLRSQALDWIMIAITELGDTPVVVAMALTIGAWLAYRRAWRTLGFWLLAIGGGSAINTAIKLVFQRVRPSDLHYSGTSVFSFPSGHSTTNALLYGFLALILARLLPPVWRIPVFVGAAVFAGAIAFSRLYLGAHWLSDVMGGLGFGMLWLAGLGFVFMLRRSERIEPLKLLQVAMLTLMVAGTANIVVNHARDMRRYAVKPHAVNKDGLPVVPVPILPFPAR